MKGKYFWLEYCDHTKERLKNIKFEIKSLLANLQHLGLRREAFIYYDELKSLLESISKSYKDLSGDEYTEALVVPELRYIFAGVEFRIDIFYDLIRNIWDNKCYTVKDQRDLISDYKEIKDLLDRLERALAYLKYSIDQLSSGEFLKQTVFYQYSFTSPLTDMPSQEKVLRAVSAVVNNYSELIFGRRWLEKYRIRPIAIAGFEDYAIYPYIFIAHYPIADTFRTRFWVSFGHEVQHEKNFIICILLDKQESWGSSKVVRVLGDERALKDKIKSLFENRVRLLFVDINNLKKWKSTRKDIIRRIFINGMYNEYQVKHPIRLLDEIVSDISNVLLSGPADFLSLLSAYIGGIFRIDNHLREDHPPLFLRFEYSLKVVEEILKLKDFIKDYSEIIDTLKEEFKEYLELIEFRNCSDTYEFFRELIIDDLFDEIVELTKLSITSYLTEGDNIFFNNNKYKQALKVKENLSDGKSIEETSIELEDDAYKIEPRVVLMAGWLKRLDEFKNLKTSSFDLLVGYSEVKRRFYPNIVTYLCGYYERVYRR